MRTFIAIELDPAIKKSIAKFIQKWDSGDRNIRWVKPEGMHLTLKFLGEIPEEKIPPIQSVLDRIAKDYSRFPLSLKGTGSFPPAARVPRVIWIGIEKSESIQQIQTRVENEFHKIGFPREKRKYHPHLTIGRVKSPHNLQIVLDSLDLCKQTEFGKMSVTKMTLFKSILKPTGAEYSILWEACLE
jgi:2'-5' RNA ligase